MDTQKLIALITTLGVIAGATLTIDTRYAKSEEVFRRLNEQAEAIESKLSEKADFELVKDIQESILEDRIEELRIKKFMLEQIEEPTEAQKWELERVADRLNKLERKLEKTEDEDDG